MEYTFENGVMMGLLLADIGASDVDDDEISKIKNGLLKYILQKGIYQGTVKLAGNFSVKFYSGFLPRRNDPASELFLNTELGKEYIYLPSSQIINYSNSAGSAEIRDTYKVIHLWSGEDVGLANKWLVRIWSASVLFKGKTPLGATFQSNKSNMDMYYKSTYTYSDKDGKDKIVSHIYLYPTKGYTDITLTLPKDTLSGIAEYTLESSDVYRSPITVPDQGSSENFIAAYKEVNYRIKRPTYEIKNADGTITNKTDWSAKPTLIAKSTTEYTEKILSNSNDGKLIKPCDIQITDLSNNEIMDLETEYIEEILKLDKKNIPIYKVKRFLSYTIK